jgi:hypothetical protein
MVNFSTSKTTEKSVSTPRCWIKPAEICSKSADFYQNGWSKGKHRSPLPPHFYVAAFTLLMDFNRIRFPLSEPFGALLRSDAAFRAPWHRPE